MKKILSSLAGMLLIGSVPLSVVACGNHPKPNDYKSEIGLYSEGMFNRYENSIGIAFYDNEQHAHALFIRRNTSGTAFEKAKNFYHLSNSFVWNRDILIHHIKYSYSNVENIRGTNFDMVTNIDILE